ncbi:hypothetical protein B0H13DRAFT_1896042 [Mycena leptocephala]|nr:hypothetical protein B0H13DRAFT_1896042 [Mycena leptocephala]
MQGNLWPEFKIQQQMRGGGDSNWRRRAQLGLNLSSFNAAKVESICMHGMDRGPPQRFEFRCKRREISVGHCRPLIEGKKPSRNGFTAPVIRYPYRPVSPLNQTFDENSSDLTSKSDSVEASGPRKATFRTMVITCLGGEKSPENQQKFEKSATLPRASLERRTIDCLCSPGGSSRTSSQLTQYPDREIKWYQLAKKNLKISPEKATFSDNGRRFLA